MGDARAVGDDERGPRPGVRFEERLGGVLVVGTHCDLGDIDIAVGAGDGAEILLSGGLAGSCELRHRTARCGLRGLAAGVRVHLGVEDEDVDVAPGTEDLVEATEADVVGPAVAADDPNPLPDQVARQRKQALGVVAPRAVDLGELVAQLGDAGSLELDLRLGILSAVEQPANELLADRGSEASHQLAGVVGLGVEGKAHAQTELGVVLEQRVVPGRPSALGVDRPGCGRQVGAVDR